MCVCVCVCVWITRIKKLKCFFTISLSHTNQDNTMVNPEHHAQIPVPAPVHAPIPAPDPVIRPANVWDEYERITNEWNQSNQVQTLYNNRNQMINNTPGYHTGNNILHIRSIQLYNWDDWNALFGTEQLDPMLGVYAEAAIDYAQDQTGTVPYAGQMEVSLVMQENYRPGIHVAIFMVHLTPHRSFYDGHIVQKEFGEGSRTHQIINNLFDPNARAVVLQATQYQFLEYIADDDEAHEVMSDCFMDPDFTTMRFSYVPHPDPEYDDGGYYVVTPNALDNHRLHHCAEYDMMPVDPAVIAIPPPPPVYDFGEIYQQAAMYYANVIYDHDHDDDDDDHRDDYHRVQG